MNPAMASVTPAEMTTIEKLRDSKYFRETFFSIVNRDEKTVPYIQNKAQGIYYVEQSDDDLILKARKLGFSSEIEGDFLFDCMTKENTNAVTMAHTIDDTKIHMQRIKFYLNSMKLLPTPLKVQLDADSATELYFPEMNSYYWIGTAGATGFGRGRQITRFHGSEVAHWRDQSVLTSVLNARSRHAKTRLETTAKGFEKFAELWNEGDDPAVKSPWKRHFFAWWMDPDNVLPIFGRFDLTEKELNIQQTVKNLYNVTLSNEQFNWYRLEKSRQADKELMPQEHPSFPQEAFLSSGRHFLNQERLAEYVKLCEAPTWVGDLSDDGHTVSFIPNPESELKIWKMPRDREMFLISGDVAEGVAGGAYSVAKVFNRSNWEVVAQWRGHCDPGKFGKIMVDMGYFWNNAVLIPELNNHGWATTERIKGEQYPHLLKTSDLWPEDHSGAKDGFPTNERTRVQIFSALSNALDQRTFIDKDVVTIREMQKLIKDERGKVVAQSGFMDTTIASAIGLYCLKFLTMDESYREGDERRAPVRVTSLVAKPRGKAGYR